MSPFALFPEFTFVDDVRSGLASRSPQATDRERLTEGRVVMSSNRTVVVFVVILLCAASVRAFIPDSGATQAAVSPADGPPSLGKWEYTSRDNSGTTWTGTLTFEKVDPTKWDAKRYFALCEIEESSPNKGTRSRQHLCEYDGRTRTVSFKLMVATIFSYSAVLSQDSKSLTNGKWTEMKGTKVVSSGEWSAKLLR
jgi:hypothetical protein